MVKSCIKRSKLKLHKHQVDVVEYLQKNRGVIAAMNLGTGKTLIGVTSSQCFLDANPDGIVVVVTPKSLQENFKKELKAYGGNDKRYQFYTIKKFATTFNTEEFPRNAYLIIDEAHNLRTTIVKSKKITASKVAVKCAALADKVLLLTATPLLNSPMDLINLVAMVKGTEQLTKNEFKKLTNIQLCNYFRNTIMFYDNPASDNYPKVKEHNIYIPMTKKYYRKYREIELRKNKKFKNPFTFLTGLRQATNIIEPCLKCTEAMKIIKKGKQTLVYSAFITRGIKVIQTNLDALGIKYVEITGKMTQEQRLNAVKKYNNGKVQVLFITKAGAEGLDLKRTQYVILLEKSWNRPVEEQVIGRAARYQSHIDLPKKEQKVNVYHFIITKPAILDDDDGILLSADQRLQEITIEKEKNNTMFNKLLQSIAINAPKGSICPPPDFKIKLSPLKKSPRKSFNENLNCNDYKIVDLRKMATEKQIKGRSNMNKQALCNALFNIKSCNDYKVNELHIMAKSQKIKHQYKMNKQELCQALKI